MTLPLTVFNLTFVLAAGGQVPGGPGVNPYSAIALHGTMSPIDLAKGLDKTARTINGTLIYIGAPQMWKYKLQVSGNGEQAPPALDGLRTGTELVVNSLVEIGYLNGGTPERAPVDGSTRTEGDYTYYRPQFVMMAIEWQIDRDEWGQIVTWSLSLEEV